MFKKVEYVGFEGRPELRAKAEHANSVMGAIVSDWHDDVEVIWRPGPDGVMVLELSLSLSLWNASAAVAGGVRACGFEAGEEHQLRIDLREVWLNLLGGLSRQQMRRLDDTLLEPVEA